MTSQARVARRGRGQAPPTVAADVIATARLITVAVAAAISGGDLSSAEWTILRELQSRPPMPMPMRDLRALSGLSAPAMTAVADRLEELGFVRRGRAPGDRRLVLLALTPAGRRRVTERIAAATSIARPAVAALTVEEEAELSRLLGILRCSLEASLLGIAHRSLPAAPVEEPTADVPRAADLPAAGGSETGTVVPAQGRACPRAPREADALQTDRR